MSALQNGMARSVLFLRKVSDEDKQRFLRSLLNTMQFDLFCRGEFVHGHKSSD
jgi:hypothetical protein